VAITFKLKRTLTPSTRPGTLQDGELAINQADGVVSWKDASGTIRNTRLATIYTEVLAVTALNTIDPLSKSPVDRRDVILFAPTPVCSKTCSATRGAFDLGGTGNKTITWDAAQSWPLDPADTPYVIAQYPTLEIA
jgi:hypothetical protein